MTSVCLLFHAHQPFRLKNYPFQLIGHDHAWEDQAGNIAILNRISDQCYLPANRILLDAIRKTDGRFRLAFSVSGTLLEQLFRYRPDVLDSFRQLSATGCVEFLAETYYHSLAGVFSATEFRRQVVKQEKAIQQLLELRPTVLRNTELLYSDELLETVAALGYKTIISEGSSNNLSEKHPNQLFRSAHADIRVLARNHALSDLISFGFGELAKETAGPAKAFVRKLAAEENPGCISLYLDFETFGEHLSRDTGIMDFLYQFPLEALNHAGIQFCLPSDIVPAQGQELPLYRSAKWTSWSDEAKDASPWLKNHMQRDAIQLLYSLESTLLKAGRPEMLDLWGKLQGSDHFYYMSTQYRNHPVHRKFNPYPGPYDAYLNYMNVLSDFRKLAETKKTG